MTQDRTILSIAQERLHSNTVSDPNPFTVQKSLARKDYPLSKSMVCFKSSASMNQYPKQYKFLMKSSSFHISLCPLLNV
jgi:hypothetical protein